MLHAAALTVSTFAAASAASATARWVKRPQWVAQPIVVRRSGAPSLRIALFSGNYNCVRDGANQALNRLVRHLIDHENADVRVYSPAVLNPAFPPEGTLVPVPSIPIPGRSEYRFASGLSRRLLQDLSEFAPDLIHVSAPDLLGRDAQRFAARHGIPVVASLHTRFETYFDYYGLGAVRRSAEHWLHRFYEASDCVLVPTSTLRAEMMRSGFSSEIRIWNRGVDPDLFSPRLRDPKWRHLHGYREDEVVPLFLGRLVLEKGLACFTDAIASVRQRGYRIRPLIIGDGPARGWLAERLPNAVFLGHMSGVALGRAVASADVLLNPSLTEAFGNVTLEAMASGLPVICPDVGSTRDLVRNHWNGIFVESTPQAFADALASLIDTPEVRISMGRAASFQSAVHSWANANAAVVDAYHALLRARKVAAMAA